MLTVSRPTDVAPSMQIELPVTRVASVYYSVNPSCNEFWDWLKQQTGNGSAKEILYRNRRLSRSILKSLGLEVSSLERQRAEIMQLTRQGFLFVVTFQPGGERVNIRQLDRIRQYTTVTERGGLTDGSSTQGSSPFIQLLTPRGVSVGLIDSGYFTIRSTAER